MSATVVGTAHSPEIQQRKPCATTAEALTTPYRASISTSEPAITTNRDRYTTSTAMTASIARC
jgi:hypothetical protein